MLTILPDWHLPAWNPDQWDAGWHDTLGFAQAMQTHWPTDAMILPYYLEERHKGVWQQVVLCPRLKRTHQQVLEDNGFRIRMAYVLLDVDCEEAHGANTEAPDEWRNKARSRAAELVKGCFRYDTARGLRVCWRLPEPVGPSDYEAIVKRSAQVFGAAGLKVDVLPWTQPMRAPRVVRDGKPQDRWMDTHEPQVFALPDATAPKPKAAPPSRYRHESGERFRLPDRIGPGDRHATLTKLAASLRAQGMDRAEILDAITDADKRHCYPPMQASPEGMAEMESIATFFDGKPAGLSPEVAAQVAAREQVEHEVEAGDDLRSPLMRGDSAELAERVLSDLEAATQGHGADGGTVPIVYSEGHFWLYNGSSGVWAPVTESVFCAQVMRMAGTRVLVGVKKDGSPKYKALYLKSSDGKQAMSAAQWMRADERFFVDAPSGIAFKSTFARVQPGSVLHYPHSPQWRARLFHDFDWTNEAPQAWLSFLADVFAPLGDDKAKTIALLGEALGAAMIGIATHYQRAIAFFGDGANGKSVTVTVIEYCFPLSAVSHLSPHEFLANGYNLAELVGKTLNICAEIPASRIDALSAATIKRVITGDKVTVRRIYGSPFVLTPSVLVIGSLNGLPRVDDESDGWFRRWIVIAFLRKFLPHEQVTDLAKRIVAEDRERIVCWMLRCAANLMERGHYDEPQMSKDAVAEWRKGLDPVIQFVEDALEPDEGGTDCKTLYQAYRTWCERNGHVALDNATFNRRFAPRAQSRFGAKMFGAPDSRQKRYLCRIID